MYRLPDPLRIELAKPLAPVLDTQRAVSLARGKFVVSVGDVVTRMFLDHGVVPRVMLVDGFTKRTHVEALPNLPSGATLVDVENPAATITEALWRAVERALSAPHPTLIHVRGEEDLAALPALVLAPEGALVCYGQPYEGVVAVTVNEASRQRARDLLEQMKVPPVDRKVAGTTEGT